MVQAIGWAAFAPVADGLGADAVALGEKTRGFGGAGDLGPGDWGGAGVGMDLQHSSFPSWRPVPEIVEAMGIGYDSQTNRIPIMLRDLTASTTVAFFSERRHILV